jgi:pantetheine-phosphate adenylyltransferase
MYKHIFVAGTFDGLHKGHDSLLRTAFQNGNIVTIGVTSDAFVKNYKAKTEKISSHARRKQHTISWLQKKNVQKRATIIPIDDPYEPAASDSSIDSLIVTEENRARGEEINIKRLGRGLASLALVEVPIEHAEDTRVISSTRIRRGEIDKKGRLVLPDNLRPELKQPLGVVLHDDMITRSLAENKGKILMTVGDMATQTLLDAGVTPTLAIVDYHVERKPYTKHKKQLVKAYKHVEKIVSGPGYISQRTVDTLRTWSQRPTTLLVEISGEEDLVTLPVIMHSPVGSVVYYGQPPTPAWACGPLVSGMVEVYVTREKKHLVEDLLKRFTIK